MKRLVTLMIAGAMSFMLSGCGQEAPKPAEVTTDATVEQVAKPEAAAPAVESDTNAADAVDADKAAGATTQE
jgi:predicted small lipoprotein YifL